MPWGISESAYNGRDLELTYQYSNFGVPGLGLKRGLGENRVIAPYATGLASMIDPSAAEMNFKRLATMGGAAGMDITRLWILPQRGFQKASTSLSSAPIWRIIKA